jgi:ferredoxin
LHLSRSARIRCPTPSHEHSPIEPGRQAHGTGWQASFTRRSGARRFGMAAGRPAPEAVDPVAEAHSLEAGLAVYGLCLRGVLEFDDAGEMHSHATGSCLQAPLCADDRPARLICLVGYHGDAIWPTFARWRTVNPGPRDPLDEWSKSVIAPLARDFGGVAVFPSDRPWQPFQKWAMAAEGLKPSPLGILIHPEFGLWHGYRGAILFGDAAVAAAAARLPRPDASSADRAGRNSHPCSVCTDKPCLKACPVDAFTPSGLDVSACRQHLAAPGGRTGCLIEGCCARDACPVGQEHRYPEEQIRFHMKAFETG